MLKIVIQQLQHYHYAINDADGFREKNKYYVMKRKFTSFSTYDFFFAIYIFFLFLMENIIQNDYGSQYFIGKKQIKPPTYIKVFVPHIFCGSHKKDNQ